MRLVNNNNRIIKRIARISIRHTLQFFGAKTVIINEVVFGIYHFVYLAVHAHSLSGCEFSLIIAGFGDIYHPRAPVCADEFIIGEH